jgi:hypothetical protein
MSGVRIPITGDASSLVTATDKANTALVNMGNVADKTSAKIDNGFKGSTGGIQKALAALGPLGGVLGKVSPAAGSAASSIAGLSSSFMALSSAGAGAAVAVGGTLAVIGGAALVIGGAASAWYSLGEALVSTGFEARDALDALEGFQKIGSDFYPVVSAEALTSFERLASVADAFDAIMNRLTVTVGASVGPELERLINITTGLALAGMHAFEIWAAGKNLLTEFADFMLGSMLHSFLPVTDAVRAMGNSLVYMAELLGKDVDPALKLALSSTNALSSAITGYAADALDGALKSLDDYAIAGGEFITVTARATDAIKDKTKATKADTKATDENIKGLTDWGKLIAESEKAISAGSEKLQASARADELATMSAMDAETARYQAKVDGLRAVASEITNAGGDELKAQEDLNKALEEAEALHVAEIGKLSDQARAKRISDERAVGSAIIGLGNDLVKATTAQYDTTTAAGREAAMKEFNTQKAAKMAIAVVAGALAVQQALSAAPPPVNFVLAGISGAAAAVELGVIAGAQPKFHMGTTGFRPDEGMAMLQRGEGVVTSQGMSRPGMREAVQAANAGGSPLGGESAIMIQYQHKVYNEFIRDNLKAGSPLTKRIDNNTKVGHRTNRK